MLHGINLAQKNRQYVIALHMEPKKANSLEQRIYMPPQLVAIVMGSRYGKGVTFHYQMNKFWRPDLQ